MIVSKVRTDPNFQFSVGGSEESIFTDQRCVPRLSLPLCKKRNCRNRDVSRVIAPVHMNPEQSGPHRVYQKHGPSEVDSCILSRLSNKRCSQRRGR
jgi:hypothetical protein